MHRATWIPIVFLALACGPYLDEAAMQDRRNGLCTSANEGGAMPVLSVAESEPGKAMVRRERWEPLTAPQRALITEWIGLCSPVAGPRLELWVTAKEAVVETPEPDPGSEVTPALVELEPARPEEKVADWDAYSRYAVVVFVRDQALAASGAAVLGLLGLIAVGVWRPRTQTRDG